MKLALLLLCVAAAMAQRPTEPTRQPPTRRPLPTGETRPFRPEDNDASMCNVMDRRCPEGQVCLERRQQDGRTVYLCQMRRDEDETCSTDIFEGADRDTERKRTEDSESRREISFERLARERAEGSRDRDVSRVISGLQTRRPCAENLMCSEGDDADTCRPTPTRPTPSQCFMQRRNNNATRCDEEGNFTPLQCRRLPGEETTDRISGVSCFCVNIMTGELIGERTRVMSRDDIPDCTPRSFRGCSVMRGGRMISVRHGQSVPRRMNNMCWRCQCNNGEFECSRSRDNDAGCGRSDPDDDSRPANCMKDGVTVMHNQQKAEGKCNRCGCRDGTLQCTKVPECRQEDADSGEGERDMKDRACDECMGMPASPVCAMRDGRTFPTRCHAMMCQGFARDEVEDGPCAERDDCIRDPCSSDATMCYDLGGETRMTRERDSPENGRLCVNREELRCLPTETRNGRRMIIEDEGQGPLEDLEEALERRRRDGDDTDDDDEDDDDDDDSDDLDDDDRTLCASDGNTYPSTCHMMAESQEARVPRVRHRGPCRRMPGEATMPTRVTNRTVCGADGVTYSDVDTMRTRGGNVRMDYMGRCMQPEGDEDDTPMTRCRMVMDNKKCPDIKGCGRNTTLSDGCCPICGSAVIMAIDQDAMDEQVRVTGGDLGSVDDFMGAFFREGGMDMQGMTRPPLINKDATRRCKVSMTRPTTTRGNTTEIVFEAKDKMMDGMFCHERAMDLMMKLNAQEETVTPESALVASAIVAPEEVVDAGATTFAASCMVLLGAYLATFLF